MSGRGFAMVFASFSGPTCRPAVRRNQGRHVNTGSTIDAQATKAAAQPTHGSGVGTVLQQGESGEGRGREELTHSAMPPPDPPGKLHPHLDTDTYCQADR